MDRSVSPTPSDGPYGPPARKATALSACRVGSTQCLIIHTRRVDCATFGPFSREAMMRSLCGSFS
eukprot:m.38059 g.38059  ORF g.38059 m.38059 type:complete len:65 (+) comp7769_c0_seq2:723-917(+)